MIPQLRQHSASTSNVQHSLQSLDSQSSEHKLHPTDYHWIDWIKQLQKNNFSFYKFDISFNSSGISNPNSWIHYFDEKVVYKLQKVMGSKEPIISNIREYESGVKSRFRRNDDGRCPHHIHALIGVPASVGNRMTSRRLKKDVESLPLVSSVFIDLIPDDDLDPTRTVETAYGYMRKRKTYRPMGGE